MIREAVAKLRVCLLFYFPLCLSATSVCYFIPPKDWECAQPQTLSPGIQIGFLGKSSALLRPSLNLAVEKVDLSLKAYIKAVRKLHEEEMHVSWRDLGDFSFHAGKGRLGEITSPSPVGNIKMLQGIFVQDGFAYILTGAAHQEDFAEYRETFLKALRSLSLASNLFSILPDQNEREFLRGLFERYPLLSSEEERQQEWLLLQKKITGDYASLGSYCHFLLLKEGHQKIFSANSGQKPSSQ